MTPLLAIYNYTEASYSSIRFVSISPITIALLVDNVVAVNRGLTHWWYRRVSPVGRCTAQFFEVSRVGNFKFAARVVQRICSSLVQLGTLASLSTFGPCPYKDNVGIVGPRL